jgi:hypothetical protein
MDSRSTATPAAPAPTPRPAEPLRFETREMIARTHRGEYLLHFVRDDSEWNGRAWATFHPHGGGYCDALGPTFGDQREMAAACDAHAAAQPVWPPMLGWPADGDLDAALALEALS